MLLFNHSMLTLIFLKSYIKQSVKPTSRTIVFLKKFESKSAVYTRAHDHLMPRHTQKDTKKTRVRNAGLSEKLSKMYLKPRALYIGYRSYTHKCAILEVFSSSTTFGFEFSRHNRGHQGINVYKNILHATDLKQNHYTICEQSIEFARAIKASIHIIHVIDPPPFLQLAQSLGFAEIIKPVKEDAQSVLNILSESFKLDLENFHVAIGSVKTEVFNCAKQLGSDLIVIGNHETGSLSSFLGSNAYSIITHAPCAVLTLK